MVCKDDCDLIIYSWKNLCFLGKKILQYLKHEGLYALIIELQFTKVSILHLLYTAREWVVYECTLTVWRFLVFAWNSDLYYAQGMLSAFPCINFFFFLHLLTFLGGFTICSHLTIIFTSLAFEIWTTLFHSFKEHFWSWLPTS